MKHRISLIRLKYIDRDFQSVVDIFKVIEQKNSINDCASLAMVAQSYYYQDKYESAAEVFVRAANIDSPASLKFCNLAFELFRKAGNTWKALQAADAILKRSPRDHTAAAFRRHHLFDFLLTEELLEANKQAMAGITANDEFIRSCELPFNNLMWCGDEGINSRIRDLRAPLFSSDDRKRRRAQPHQFARKIRIGYFSADFSSAHATIILMRGVLECHDRNDFEITLYCNTPDSLIANDAGFRQEVGKLVSIRDLTDAEAHARIRDDGIDILVDLKGHTSGARIGLINSGPAPIQVSWLGFPGSVTGIDCDYVIGDPTVTPDTSKPFYHEKFCRLPECYQANDNKRRPLPPPMRRQDAGIPTDRMIFASFNNVKKISPETIGAWASILRNCPDSILWMMCDNEIAQENLLRYLDAQSVAPDRVIFARPIGYEAHIARLQAADLCLDTFPCNGHTTTSDCLWAGLPVLTTKGSNFASRVSESLLVAAGVPELVSESTDEYVALACELAKNQSLLKSLRQRLLDNRFSAPLFDTERFTRHLERGYRMMVERRKAGLDPDNIDVPAFPPRQEPFR